MKKKEKLLKCESCGHEVYVSEDWPSPFCPECEDSWIEIK